MSVRATDGSAIRMSTCMYRVVQKMLAPTELTINRTKTGFL